MLEEVREYLVLRFFSFSSKLELVLEPDLQTGLGQNIPHPQNIYMFMYRHYMFTCAFKPKPIFFFFQYLSTGTYTGMVFLK